MACYGPNYSASFLPVLLTTCVLGSYLLAVHFKSGVGLSVPAQRDEDRKQARRLIGACRGRRDHRPGARGPWFKPSSATCVLYNPGHVTNLAILLSLHGGVVSYKNMQRA